MKFRSRQQLSRNISSGTVALFAVTLLAIVTTSHPALAQTETVLHDFCSLTNCVDGTGPTGALIMDSAGNLFGMTDAGGANNQGTVYELSADGTYTVLNSFTGYPVGGLVADPAGNLYGATDDGGTNNLGTIFKLDPSGTETVLHNFGGNPKDGNFPNGPLVLDRLGNLYGTTGLGGTEGGTIFRLRPDGTETVLHFFARDGVDGIVPYGGVVFDRQGNLYGATNEGGLYNQGVVYELTSKGVYSVLYTFGTNSGDGSYPDWSLTLDAQGNLYGVTRAGGTYGHGTVFKLTPGSPWVETILHTFNFSDQSVDGFDPVGALVIDAKGNLFGVTTDGGSLGLGTVYKLTPDGTETIIHNFAGGQAGDTPNAGLLLDSSHNLYGTAAYAGGPSQDGVIYKLTR